MKTQTDPEGLIVWTSEEGGTLQARWARYDDYIEVVALGYMPQTSSLGVKRRLPVAYVAWCPVAVDYDFVLGCSREASSGRVLLEDAD